ncbi:hypothetical protein, partial [Thiothrix eikelboomii]|uniref:hypothetical protein n=1 Tax=Thiothrix eikelboomii TaxID=92487 RepID=UPI003BAEA954
ELHEVLLILQQKACNPTSAAALSVSVSADSVTLPNSHLPLVYWQTQWQFERFARVWAVVA